MFGHLLPTIELSRPASSTSESIKPVKDQSGSSYSPQFGQEPSNQSPENNVNESTILPPTDIMAPNYQPTPESSALHEPIPENVEHEDLTPYKFRL